MVLDANTLFKACLLREYLVILKRRDCAERCNKTYQTFWPKQFKVNSSHSDPVPKAHSHSTTATCSLRAAKCVVL